ncbi:MAG: hypothetical protein ACRDTP_03270, partial [Mycobacteriales bacterium]
MSPPPQSASVVKLSAERAELRDADAIVLVVGTDDWAIEQSAASLDSAGYRVLRCHEPGQPAFPCNAVLPGRQ